MKHNVSGRKLNRDSQHRQALFANLVTALIEHGSIETTLEKAKAVQPLVDKLMTKAKKGSLHHRRMIGKVLPKRPVVNRLVDSIAPATGERTSGFTRIIKLGRRRGDNAMMARFEFVDAMPMDTAADEPKKKKKAEKKEDSKPSQKKVEDTTQKPAKKLDTDLAKKGKEKPSRSEINQAEKRP